jgi:hypothetical protein
MPRRGPERNRGAFTVAARRYLGEFPKGGSKAERLSWWRQAELKLAGPWYPVLIVVVIVINATWAYIAFGALVVWSVLGLARLTRDIRRARHVERGAST